MDIEQEIADEISGIQVGSGYYSTTIGINAAQEAAAALMPLVRRAQAEARIAFADRLTRMGVHTFNIHDIRKYAAEQEVEHE